MKADEERKLPSLLHHIFNADSRKVGLGWWIFIVATWLLAKAHVISADQWMECVMLSTALVGGGTIMDSFLNKKFGVPLPPAPPPPDKKDAAS
jgi:hypothetical protein